MCDDPPHAARRLHAPLTSSTYISCYIPCSAIADSPSLSFLCRHLPLSPSSSSTDWCVTIFLLTRLVVCMLLCPLPTPPLVATLMYSSSLLEYCIIVYLLLLLHHRLPPPLAATSSSAYSCDVSLLHWLLHRHLPSQLTVDLSSTSSSCVIFLLHWLLSSSSYSLTCLLLHLPPQSVVSSVFLILDLLRRHLSLPSIVVTTPVSFFIRKCTILIIWVYTSCYFLSFLILAS